MPTSRPDHLSWLCQQVLSIHPKSILDIGIGFGSKGMLFREYTDIWQDKYHEWKTQIDGIEIFKDYITDLQKNIYDNIYYGNALEIIDNLPNYDLIYLGDVIEHLTKKRGKKLLSKVKKHGKYIIIATPLVVLQQGTVFKNEYERHLSQWYPKDFKGAQIITIFNILIAKYGI